MTSGTPEQMLEQLESEALERGLLLRLQVGRPLGLWSLRLVVAQPVDGERLLLQGEMKGWAYGADAGLQLLGRHAGALIHLRHLTENVDPGLVNGIGNQNFRHERARNSRAEL